MLKLTFSAGLACIKSGRKTVANVFYCPEFSVARGVKVVFDPEFPYILDLPYPRVSALCRDMADVEQHFKKEYPAAMWPNESL